MNRTVDNDWFDEPSVPRTRGDEPIPGVIDWSTHMRSPHARG